MRTLDYAVILMLFSCAPAKSLDTTVTDKLKSREWIKSYHLKVKAVDKFGDNTTETVCETWFDGKSYRMDIIINTSNNVKNSGSRSVYCTDCDGKINYTMTTILAKKGGSMPISWLKDKDTYAANNPYYEDWKYLGFKHSLIFASNMQDMSHYKSFAQAIANQRPAEAGTISEYTDQGTMTTHKVWISDKYLAPTKFTSTDAQSAFQMDTTVSYERIDNDNHYYPSSFESKTLHSGKLTRHLFVSVLVTEINLEIAPSVFTTASMSLPDGLPVLLPNRKITDEIPTIESGKINSDLTVKKRIGEYESKHGPLPNPSPQLSKPSLISQAWPYFLGFVVFAVIGFWLLRKQRQAAKEG